MTHFCEIVKIVLFSKKFVNLKRSCSKPHISQAFSRIILRNFVWHNLGHEKRTTMVSRLIFLHFWVTFFSWLIMATFPTLFCMSIFFANLDLGSTEFRLKFLSISLSFISSSGRRRVAPTTPNKIFFFTVSHPGAWGTGARSKLQQKITWAQSWKKKDKDNVSLPDNALHLSSNLINGKNLDRVKYALGLKI